MERDDLEGAIAAAEYFALLYPYVYATGDLTAWRELSHPECVFCESVITNVSEIAVSGGYVVDLGVVVLSSKGYPPMTGNVYFGVDVEISSSESVGYNAAGEELDAWPSGENLMLFALESADAGWQIREVSIEELGADENT